MTVMGSLNRNIVNGGQLPAFNGKEISITGFVTNITAGSTTFSLRTTDDIVVSVYLSKPIDTNLEGYVEVHGISRGRTVEGSRYFVFQNQNFDAEHHNKLCQLLQTVPNLFDVGALGFDSLSPLLRHVDSSAQHFAKIPSSVIPCKPRELTEMVLSRVGPVLKQSLAGRCIKLPTASMATHSKSGGVLPEPQKTTFPLLRITLTVIPGLLIGAMISKNIANFLEENDLFVPSDDDDDDD